MTSDDFSSGPDKIANSGKMPEIKIPQPPSVPDGWFEREEAPFSKEPEIELSEIENKKAKKMAAALSKEEKENLHEARMQGSLMNPAIMRMICLLSAPPGAVLLFFGGLMYAKTHNPGAGMGGDD